MQLCHVFQLLYHLRAAKVIFNFIAKDLINVASYNRLPHKVCSFRPILLWRVIININRFRSGVRYDFLNLGFTSTLYNRLQIVEHCQRINIYFGDTE